MNIDFKPNKLAFESRPKLSRNCRKWQKYQFLLVLFQLSEFYFVFKKLFVLSLCVLLPLLTRSHVVMGRFYVDMKEGGTGSLPLLPFLTPSSLFVCLSSPLFSLLPLPPISLLTFCSPPPLLPLSRPPALPSETYSLPAKQRFRPEHRGERGCNR